jgi:S1-C subfamily serine protease
VAIRTGISLLVLVLVVALGGCGDDAAPAQQSTSERINQLYRTLSPSVVFVQAELRRPPRRPFLPPRRAASTGTGFAYDGSGHIVTNAHVVEGARRVSVRDDAGLVEADVIGLDLSTDLAVLAVDPADLTLKPLSLGRVETVEVGDEVLAIGNPFGLEDTITHGIVSARQRRIGAPNGYVIEDVIQTDAAVNPGNSGGPLIDMDGRVIGVNSQIATGGDSRSSAGIAFAVPVSTVREIVPDLIDDGRVERPFLGVSTIEVTPSLADRLQLATDAGVLVVAVAPRGPAAKAGLRPAPGAGGGALIGGGDVIVSVGGAAVSTPADVADAVLSADIGDELRLEVIRGGERREVTVTLGARPGSR